MFKNIKNKYLKKVGNIFQINLPSNDKIHPGGYKMEEEKKEMPYEENKEY